MTLTEKPAPATPTTQPKVRATVAAFNAAAAKINNEPSAEPKPEPPQDDQGKTQPSEQQPPKKDAKPQAPARPAKRPEGEETDESFTDIDPTTLAPELQKVHKSLLAGFHKARQKDRAAVKAAETAVRERDTQLKSFEGWDPIVKLYNEDPEFREGLLSLARREKPTPKAAKPHQPKALPQSAQDYLNGLDAKDRETTQKFIELTRDASLAEVTDALSEKDQRIRKLEAQLEELASSQRRETDTRINQDSAKYQDQFLTACPTFKTLKPTLQRAFIKLATDEVQRDPRTDVAALYREFESDLTSGQDEHTNAEIERLREQSGRTPPAAPGNAASPAVRLSASDRKGTFFTLRDQLSRS